MTSERMPLTRLMIQKGTLPEGVVLFDIQVAQDLAMQHGVNFDSLGPIRPPYPVMFVEYGVGEHGAGCVVTQEDNDIVLELFLYGPGAVVLGPLGQQWYKMNDQGALESKRITQKIADGYRPEATEDLMMSNGRVCMAALSLMNCRNVKTEGLGSIKMRRSGTEKRRGIKPVEVRYNTIILPGGGSHRVGSGSSTHHRATALHRVRGHFKTFTADKPLLGKHVGTYWWGWNVRGSADEGAVVSDYKLQGAQ